MSKLKASVALALLLAGFATACADVTAPSPAALQAQCTPTEGQGGSTHC